MSNIVFLVLLNLSAFSQDSSSHIKNDEWKVEFDVPPSWTITKKDAGYVLGSKEFQGFILINSARFKSIAKLKDSIKKGIQQEEGTDLKISGKLYPMGDVGVSALLEGTLENEPAKAFLISLLPKKGGIGITCIIVSKRPYFTQSHIDQLKMLARSLRFF